ncbi:MAG: WecB/TagA/CpsF family glycosyltransferase [Vulcanimicrobiota bacterium]
MVYQALGVKFHPVTRAQAVDRVREMLTQDRFHQVVTLGTEMVMRAQENGEFREVVNQADLVTADGVGLVLASKLCNLHTPERVAGIELLVQLMEHLPREVKYFLLGAAPGVAEQAAQNLRAQYPGLAIVGVQDGYFQDDEAVLQAIEESGAHVLLVGLGSPRQEDWLYRHRHRLTARVGIGVGGSFDVISGRLSRAPRWMIALHLEWLYRLLREPRRILRMMALPRFAWRVLVSGGRAVQQLL